MKLFFLNIFLLNLNSLYGSVNKCSSSLCHNRKFDFPSEVRRYDPEKKEFVFKKWIHQLFVEGERKFDMKNVNKNCAEDFYSFRAHLYDNQTIWAVRMLESSEWPSVGILAGVTHHLGHYSECLKARAHKFRGQYCLVESDVKFDFENIRNEETINISSRVPEDRTAWQLMKRSEDHLIYLPRNEINWAMCIPSSCSNADLQMSLTSVLSPLFQENNLNISINVNPRNCQTKKEKIEYPFTYIYTKNLMLFLIIFVLLASVVDFLSYRRDSGADVNRGWHMIVFRSFSVRNTFKNLVHYSPSTTHIAIYTLKTLFMCTLIVIHKPVYYFQFGMFQSDEWEWKKNDSNLYFHGTDPFFLISGFVMYLTSFNSMKKNGHRFFFFYVVCRYIRMVTLLMFFLSFAANILPYIGDGPLWPSFVNWKFGECQSIWWRHLLLINNVRVPTRECFITSWHVAVDFQLSILGAVILLIMTKNRKLGILSLGFAYLLSTAIVFYKTYSMNFVAYYNWNLRFCRRELALFSDKMNFYFLPYDRTGSYLLGFISAMLVQTLNTHNYKFSLFQVTLMILWDHVTTSFIRSYGLSINKSGRLSTYDLLFAGLFKLVLYLPLAARIGVYYVGVTPPKNKLFANMIERFKTVFTWSGFVPLGRLTFSAGLTHIFLLIFHVGIQPSINTSTKSWNLVYVSLSDIIISFSVAFVSYLLCEGPVSLLLRDLKRRNLQLTMVSCSDGC